MKESPMIELPHLPASAGAYSPRDLVALWSVLGGAGKELVVEAALQLVQTHRREVDDVYVRYEQFHGTQRWPTRKWRLSCGRPSKIKATTRTVAGLEQLIRAVATDPFLADECILWRAPLHHGHFAIGGHERRIIIIGITSETHYNGLFGPMRARLQELISLPPAGHEAWTDVSEPDWCATDRWLSEGA